MRARRHTFLGDDGPRVLWQLQLTAPWVARSIRTFSLHSTEDEVLLPPYSQFEVISSYQSTDGLLLVQCRQVESEYPLFDMDHMHALRRLMSKRLQPAVTALKPFAGSRTPSSPPLPLGGHLPVSVPSALEAGFSRAFTADAETAGGEGGGDDGGGNEGAGGEEECAFWFVKASELRAVGGAAVLLQMQTLQFEHPNWLVRRTISFAEGRLGAYRSIYLAVCAPRALQLPSCLFPSHDCCASALPARFRCRIDGRHPTSQTALASRLRRCGSI